jgi:hypothetical protein
MTDSPYRSGQIDVILPENTPRNQLRSLIEAAVEDHLAKTNEWQQSVDFQTAYPAG